jgi:DNA-binding Xre family transcriptional regulator
MMPIIMNLDVMMVKAIRFNTLAPICKALDCQAADILAFTKAMSDPDL